MAFKRNNFKSLKSTKRDDFGSKYKFSKKVPNFKAGSDVYIIPLGLDQGFYETPCHKVRPHKVDGQVIGFGTGVTFEVLVRCDGVDEDGNYKDSLCCRLAKKEREREEDSEKRIITSQVSRVHLPILILGNSLGDPNKASYPISKVSILNDLKSESGLNFSFLDMATFTFKTEILAAYGKKLKEEGTIDYEMDEESDEFFEEICNRLTNTIIKIHGISKAGWKAALREYSFFPIDGAAVASGSGAAEKEAISHYKENTEIMNQINTYLQLFDVEVDSLIKPAKDKDLQEYYNSALGLDLNAPESASDKVVSPSKEEKIEVVNTSDEDEGAVPPSDEEMDKLLTDPFNENEGESDASLDEMELGLEDDESFFEE